jgi:hypothetical protein
VARWNQSLHTRSSNIDILENVEIKSLEGNPLRVLRTRLYMYNLNRKFVRTRGSRDRKATDDRQLRERHPHYSLLRAGSTVPYNRSGLRELRLLYITLVLRIAYFLVIVCRLCDYTIC